MQDHGRFMPIDTVFYFETGIVPSCGYKVFKLIKKNDFNRHAVFWPLTRKTSGNEISKSSNSMENEFIHVLVNNNGTIRITDKQTGKIFDNLNYYEDEGDCGDYWMYYPPYRNKKYTSLGLNADICVEDNGELSCTIAVKTKMQIPGFAYRHENGVKGESRRADELKELVITAYYTLKKGAKQVDVKLIVNNNCEDHRLKLSFDTGIKAEYADASGHFNVDRRPLLPLKDLNNKYYNELTTQPMQNFIDLSDGEFGFGIVSNSFIEYEALPNRESTLRLTLFRAVRNIICTEMRSSGSFPNQKGGQCLKELVYEYAICPHTGDWREGMLYKKADEFSVQLKLAQTCKQQKNGILPLDQSFFSVPDQLQLSALKRAKESDDIIVRLYNPYEMTVTGDIKFHALIKEAAMTNLNEDIIADVLYSKNRLHVQIEPNKIITYKVKL